MLKLQVYQGQIIDDESLEHFVDQVYGTQMPHLASDLLKEGITPTEIIRSVDCAIKTARMADLDIRRHFQFVYTQQQQGLVNDCRLSRLAMGLVLMHVEHCTAAIAKWRVRLLEKHL